MWRLSRKRPEDLDLLLSAPEQVLNQLPDEDTPPEGAFFPEASKEDYERQRREDDGTQEWLDRLNRLP